MARALRVADLRDFTGGLRLRADQFQLGSNESPDLLNVDVDPRGGFGLRRGVDTFADALPAQVDALWDFKAPPATSQILAASGTAVYMTTGTTWSKLHDQSVAGWTEAATMNAAQYVVNGTDRARWDGATWTVLTDPSTASPVKWANDFAAPSTGYMPTCRHVAVFKSHLFCGYTNEGSTDRPSRLRFSHPFKPEAWRVTDWFDIDPGHDGDFIVGLLPFLDHMLVFKQRATYAVYGDNFESWQVQNITPTAGSVAAGAACASPTGAYFFDATEGVTRWDGRHIAPVFEPLQSALGDDIRTARMGEVRLAWMRDRLWVSVPWQETDTRVFVYDPSVGKRGAWVVYGLPVGPMHPNVATGQAPLWLAGSLTETGRVYSVELEGRSADTFGAGETAISSHYVTSWMDLGSAAQKKRFRRPYVVYRNDDEAQVTVDVFSEYDESRKRRSYTDVIGGIGTVARFDVNRFGDGSVFGGSAAAHTIKRGGSLGTAHAVQLRFNGPAGKVDWGVDSISVPYQPKKVR